MTPAARENETLQDFLLNAMATPDQGESSIPELQAALGPLLLSRASPPNRISQRPGSYKVAHGGRDDLPPRELVQLPKWTGAFRLFDFPRELRDTIYHHVVYWPEGILYTAHTKPGFQHTKSRSSSDIVNLFLVSKQVYHEAIQVFGRSNSVALSANHRSPREGYRKPLVGLLRLFPEPAANALTKVKHVYHDTIIRPMWLWGYAPSHDSIASGGDGTGQFHKRQQPGETFLDILRDAHAVTQRFPRLKVFHAEWHAGRGCYGYPSGECAIFNIARFLENSASHEDAVKMWLDLMRGWLHKSNVIPLACVWFGPQGSHVDGFGREMDEATNDAYQIVVKESKDRVDIEASGTMWLEELEAASKSWKKKRNSGRETAQK